MANKWVSLSTEERELIYILVACQDGRDRDKYQKLAKKLEKANTRIKVSSGKQKGRSMQYWVCEQISKLTGIPYKQSDDECEIHSREMGQHGTDIVLRGKAKKLFPYSVECKAQESLNLVDTIEQAKANVLPGTDWIVVHRKKALSSDIVMMEWDTFAKLVETSIKYYNP